MRPQLLFFLGAVSIGCSGTPVDPFSDMATIPDDQQDLTSTTGGVVIRLLQPTEHAVLLQNDSTTGCTAHPTRGYGFRIAFSWRLVADTVLAGYGLNVKHANSRLAWIDILVEQSNHLETSCNGFVADHNLQNWEWRVRPLYSDGQWGPWTDTSTFHFAACRHPDGRRCTAPG